MNDEWGDVPPHWMVYFTVVNTDDTIDKLQQLGGKVNVPPTDIPIGRFSVVADPQGAVFTVIQLNS